MLLITLILSLTANAGNISKQDRQDRIDDAIDDYIHDIAKDAKEVEHLANILGDTVLEGDACDRLYRGRLTKRCKAEILDQLKIERKIRAAN